MPAKNTTKQYVENGYYHLYNRGVEKRTIFSDQQDYSVFLSYMKQYLTPKNESELYNKLTDTNISSKERDRILKLLRLNNFYDEITLLAYCLMPNHFHFSVKQKNAEGIDKFMQSFCTRYTIYFNKKYKRVGPLYQSTYKAVLVETNEQFLHLTRYIHRQALALQGDTWMARQPSSYLVYLEEENIEWVQPNEVLSYFSKTNSTLSYQSFVEGENDFGNIKDIFIDGDDHC